MYTLTVRAAIRWLAAAAVTGVSVLTLVNTARAASDLQVTNIDCAGHPRGIAISNNGTTEQGLVGWKLMSDKPEEVFDLDVVGSVAAGETIFVLNGHNAPLTPTVVGGQRIFGWKPSDVYDPALFVLDENGTDYIRLVDATGFPWRDVSDKPCPGTTEIPAFQQPATPTASPAATEPGAGGGGQTGGNQAGSFQTDGGAVSQDASQNASASGNTNASRAGTTTAQTGNASGQVVGGPASGIGVLSGSSGQPLAGYALPLGLLGVVAGGALALVGLRTIRRGLRHR